MHRLIAIYRICYIRKLPDQGSMLYVNYDNLVTARPSSDVSLPDVNRIGKDETLPALKARILVMSVSGEASHQYIPIMNCIFAAQKAVGTNLPPAELPGLMGLGSLYPSTSAKYTEMTLSSCNRLHTLPKLLTTG